MVACYWDLHGFELRMMKGLLLIVTVSLRTLKGSH
jgi:hypothetical protein